MSTLSNTSSTVNRAEKKVSSWDYKHPLILRQNSVIRANLYCLRSNLKRRKSTANERQSDGIDHLVLVLDGVERAALALGLIGQLQEFPISHPLVEGKGGSL
jgi:hypothetical protein